MSRGNWYALLVLEGGATLFSNPVKGLSKMIDALVVELSSNETNDDDQGRQTRASPH